MSTHPRSSLRDARANGAITVVLFLASCLLVVSVVQLFFGVDGSSEPQEYKFRPTAIQSKPEIVACYVTEPLHIEIAQFAAVEGQPADSLPLRNWLAESPCTPGMRVLELGTSTGVIAITCSAQGAHQIISLESNSVAIANARYNAQQLQLTNIEWRLTATLPASPFAVVLPQEQFDRIIVNYGWEERSQLQDNFPDSATKGAVEPDHWRWIEGILRESASHLRTGGRIAVVCRQASSLNRLIVQAPSTGWQVVVASTQPHNALPEDLSTGYVLELQRDGEASASGVSPLEKSPADNLLK